MAEGEAGKDGPVQSEASVLAIRLGSLFLDQTAALLKSFDLTPLQYMFLRILYLRDPDRRGMSRGEMEKRANRSGPEVTRVLDRLEDRGLIERIRTDADRRTVLARLTGEGIAMNGAVEGPIVALNRSQFGHMRSEDVLALAALIRTALAGADQEAQLVSMETME